MKSYLIRIVASALLITFCDLLAPRGWKKYMSIITGLLLLAMLLEPLANIRKLDFFPDAPFPQTELTQGTKIYSDLLRQEFSQRLGADIRERITNEFSKDVTVETDIEIDEEGKLLRIREIILYGHDLSPKIKERIQSIYNVDEVILRAD